MSYDSNLLNYNGVNLENNQSHQSQTYNDVLKRIYNLMQTEGKYLQKVTSFPTIHQHENQSQVSYNKDMEENHQALKKMIKMIDLRQTSIYKDSLSFDRNRFQGRTNRFIPPKERTNVKQKQKGENPKVKGLAEVRQHLQKAIAIIDCQIKEKDKSDFQLQTLKKSGYVTLKNILDDSSSSIKNGKIKKEDQIFIKIPRKDINQSQAEHKYSSNPNSAIIQEEQREHLNLKQSFDLQYETELQNILSKTPTFEQNFSISIPQKEYHSQPKLITPFSSIQNQKVNKVNFGPTALIRQHSLIPFSIRYSSFDNKHIEQRAQQLSPRIRFNYCTQQQFVQIPQTIIPKTSLNYTDYPGCQVKLISQKLYNCCSLKDSNSTLKKSKPTKTKFSFRNHLEEKKTGSDQLENNYTFRTFQNQIQPKIFNFPKPYNQESDSIQSPFQTWLDQPEEVIRIQSLQKDNLTSMAELSDPEENYAKDSIIHQMEESEYSKLKPSVLNQTSTFGCSTKGNSVGNKLKRKGICLYQPTNKFYFK